MHDLVAVTCEKMMQTRAYTVLVLGTEEKRFAIYAEPGVGKVMQMYFTETPRARPHTHDLVGMFFRGLGVRVRQVVLNEIQDTIYFARLYLEQQIRGVVPSEEPKGRSVPSADSLADLSMHILELDARPSDAVALALTHRAPIFCTREVFEKAVPIEE